MGYRGMTVGATPLLPYHMDAPSFTLERSAAGGGETWLYPPFRRFQLRARVGSPWARLQPPPRQTVRTDFPYAAFLPDGRPKRSKRRSPSSATFRSSNV